MHTLYHHHFFARQKIHIDCAFNRRVVKGDDLDLWIAPSLLAAPPAASQKMNRDRRQKEEKSGRLRFHLFLCKENLWLLRGESFNEKVNRVTVKFEPV